MWKSLRCRTGPLEFDLCNFFPDVPEDDWDPYASHLTPEHKVRFNLACFLVRLRWENHLGGPVLAQSRMALQKPRGGSCSTISEPTVCVRKTWTWSS